MATIKIFKTKTGKYGYRVYSGNKQWQKVVGSKSATKRIIQNLEYKYEAKRIGIISDSDKTFKSYSKLYIDFIELRRSPGTHKRYKGLLETYICKHLGERPIVSISRGNIRDMLLKEYSKGASRSSIELMHVVCSGVFQYAIDDESITTNPTRGLLKRFDFKRKKQDITPLSEAEMVAVLSEIKTEYRTFFSLLFESGLRIGEALALMWSDIDLHTRKITVNKTAKDQNIRQVTKNYINRTVDISSDLLDILKQHQKESKQKIVFHKNGKMLSDNTLRREFSRACKKIKIGHRRPHDTRHTFASLHLMNGSPITYVQKMLGHSSAQITLTRYAHYIPDEANNYCDNLKRR